MTGLADIQKNLASLAEAREAARQAQRVAGLNLRAAEARLASLARSDPQGREASRLREEIAAHERAAAAARARLDEHGKRFAAAAGALLEIPLDDLAAGLDDHIPVLLFPVRLETKYGNEDGATVLRVRIFPDDAQVTAHDPLLSEAEARDGATYWAGRSAALDLAGDARRQAEQGAWNLLSARYGGPRARYVARQTKPVGWPSAGAAAPALTTRTGVSGVPPTARLMPDFFVVRALDQSGGVIAEGRGRIIPDRLVMGPDPEAPAAALSRAADGTLAAGDDLAWLIDYDRAVAAGMAVTLAMPGRVPVARIVAMGLRLSLSPEQGAATLETLLGEHKFTRGIDVLRQGAPTNNTETASSAFTTDFAADEALVEQEIDGRTAAAVTDHAGKCDAQRLAEAFGISFEELRDWPDAGAGDIAQALAMNTALWPATIGQFLGKMTGERIPPGLREAIRTFALTYVTGRSLLPAIRIGAQPYGVLATSNLRALAAPSREAARDPIEAIKAGLRWARREFEKLEPGVAQFGRGADPLAMTLKVIGQQASSAAFASRKAVSDELSWNTLQFNGVIPLVLMNWYQALQAARGQAFQSMGIDPAGLPIAGLTFFTEADALNAPVIDRDPEVPLSETEPVAAFDGSRNYIAWLLSATTADLRGEVFTDAAGNRIAPPGALLYRLLHNAWTSAITQSTEMILARLRPELIASSAYASIVNAEPQKVVAGGDTAAVNAAAIGLSQNPRLLGDHVIGLARAGTAIDFTVTPEALPLQSQRAAMARLQDLPSAALERLFAEHVDLASYRLDAWQTGLVSRQLDLMRRSQGRARGIYIGAYGYVEDLEPKRPALPVPPETVPEPLRGAGPVTERAGNGGFVHAPSLNHAVTAAVLRNAYLTHADETLRDTMSINMSSRRVRLAMGLIEGMRNGQELAALLGYQLERGLHERHPGLELDQYIYALRERFPLVSRRLTPVPDGTPAEQIEARNVVDGYDLVEHVKAKSYPYGIAGLAAAGTPEALAITAEIDRLADALDAVADLLTAESVHQAVTSNIARARGALAAVTDGEIPPVPDVAATPRSGRVLTQRTALFLPAAAAGWTAPASPRGAANPALNAWLAAQLPDPARIALSVRASGAPTAVMTLAGTGLDAIDAVLMCGDRFGDGSSELERHLADHWRRTHAIGDEVTTLFADPAAGGAANAIVIDAAGGAPLEPLATLLPQLRALRRLVSSSRGLHAEDFRMAADAVNGSPANPKGYVLDGAGDLASLPSALAATRAALAAAAAGLTAALAALAPLDQALAADPPTFVPAAWTAPLAALRDALRSIARFGAPEALPRSAAGVTASAGRLLIEQGRAVAAAIAKRLENADAALAPLPVEPPLADAAEEARRKAARLEERRSNLADAARQLLGSAFVTTPLFAFDAGAGAELSARRASPIEEDPLVLEGWLQSIARVRPRMADVALASAAAQWTTGREPAALPLQLPLRAGDPWIGRGWTAPPGDGDIMSVMTLDCPADLSGPLQGLLIDEWTEVVPGPRETTGIAFNFDRPNAAPPQALLLACPPDPDGRWRWDELFGTVTDTFDRARLRAIEPDLVQGSALFQILPMTLMSFMTHTGFAMTYLNRDLLSVAQLKE